MNDGFRRGRHALVRALPKRITPGAFDSVLALSPMGIMHKVHKVHPVWVYVVYVVYLPPMDRGLECTNVRIARSRGISVGQIDYDETFKH